MKHYLDLAPVCFFSMDDHGHLLAVNEYFCTLVGIPRDALLAQNFSERVSFGTRIFCQTHFFPMMRIKDSANEVFMNLIDANRKQIPVLLNARRVEGDRPEIVCAALVIENRNQFENEIIAAKKFAEQALRENTELQQTRQQLQQNAEELDAQVFLLEQRNRDLQQVNRVMTHNLQEPLRKIMVLASKIKHHHHQQVPAEVLTLLERISTVALHTRELIDQVQRFVQIDMLDSEAAPLNINQLLESAASRQQAGLPPNSMTLQLSAVPPLQGHAADLRYLFEELLHNACKFAHPQRPLHITVSTQVTKSNKFRRLEHRYRYTDFVCVRISDNGIGFDNSYSETIFQLFQKLDPYSAGMGLGLALCKKIIERHQGFMTATSTLGVGTEICCYLPLEA